MMTRGAVMRLTAALFAFAAHGCSGYAEGGFGRDSDSSVMESAPPPSAPPPRPDAGMMPEDNPWMDAGMLRDASTPVMPPDTPDAETMLPDADIADAGVIDAAPEDDPNANVRIARSEQFDGYLTDSSGRALYMFVGDFSGSSESACTGDCARDWPPFDVPLAVPGAGIDPAYVSRYHRQDGLWQTTYKGRALYYRAAESGTTVVTADGADGRWFVARNYFVFMSTARTFTPSGGVGTNAPFLTDGFGRALYVCLDDKPQDATREASSSCDTRCTETRPTFPAAMGAAVLPSSLDAAALREMARPDEQSQLTYRGWPLYYFAGDTTAGATAGHNELAWRAIDPRAFGTDPSAGSSNP